ncbi:MAG: HAMP domain-containing histidine kinase [Planctomycetes bacterium]|nr:HAMP domain-containing histidine kinase [Planctomycetota bacterium]
MTQPGRVPTLGHETDNGRPVRKEASPRTRILTVRRLVEEAGAAGRQADDFLRHGEFEGLERDLAQCQRMATLGLLIAGISHDFKNILTRLSLCAELTQDAEGGESGAGAILRRTVRQGLALSEVLLSFSRRREDLCEPTDVGLLLHDVLRLVETELRIGGVRIERALESVGVLDVNPGLLQNVFLNLLLNAREAMPQGGTLVVALASDGEDVRIRFSDSGAGMNPDALSHVFEPFYTTKRFRGDGCPGTGLGLYMSSQLVRRHGGRITCESTPGQGTTFTIRLPRLRPSPPGEAAPVERPS